MSNLVIVGILVLISVAFLVMEIFLFPGFSICGIVSLAFAGVAVWYSFSMIGVAAGLVTVVIWLIVLAIAIWAFVKSKTLDKMSLNTELKETSNLYDMNKVEVGMKGVTSSRLAPIGKVIVNGKEFEAKSMDGFVDQKCEVEVTEIEDNKLIVKAL